MSPLCHILVTYSRSLVISAELNKSLESLFERLSGPVVSLILELIVSTTSMNTVGHGAGGGVDGGPGGRAQHLHPSRQKGH